MFQFGEASRLYAENVPVVREMQKAFTEDLKEFFAQVSEAVRRNAEPLKSASLLDGTSWYWWSGPTEWDHDLVKVWCTWNVPEIITEHRIPLYLGADTLDAAGQERVAALGSSLAQWNRPKKTSAWRALQLEAKWKASEDPVEATAAPIVAALRALETAAPSPKKRR